MNIQPNFQTNFNYRYPKSVKSSNPSFCARLTHMNLGMMPQGLIGQVSLRNITKNTEELVNVFKHFDCGDEHYVLKDFNNEKIGEVTLRIKKFLNYDKIMYNEDPSHVFVDGLFNYSKPGTPFHSKKIDYYKNVGTRLLQIAQRRSDETQCRGNVKLVTMPESRSFYLDKIKMRQDPLHPKSGMLMLPPDSKEPLSRLDGGL